VVREQASRVVDRIGGRREGMAHWSRGFHSGANQVAGSDSGGADEQLRAPARGLRELSASVRRAGRCRGVWRGTRVAVHGGSMTAARRHSGSEWAEEGKGLFTGRVLLL
jgi:hypothetical protein